MSYLNQFQYTGFCKFDDIIDDVIRNTYLVMNNNEITLNKKIPMYFRLWAHGNITKLKNEFLLESKM